MRSFIAKEQNWGSSWWGRWTKGKVRFAVIKMGKVIFIMPETRSGRNGQFDVGRGKTSCSDLYKNVSSMEMLYTSRGVGFDRNTKSHLR